MQKITSLLELHSEFVRNRVFLWKSKTKIGSQKNSVSLAARIISSLLLILLVGLLVAPVAAQTESTASEENSAPLRLPVSPTLPDIVVFEEVKYGMWAGSGGGISLTTETDGGNPTLPIDSAETYNNLPSYKIETTGSDGWWSAILAGADWEAYSLAPYIETGALEFNIKGLRGGEQLQIGLQDQVPERNPTNLTPSNRWIDDYVSVSNEWRPVRIPLTDLVAGNTAFDPENIFVIELASVSSTPITVWLNDIRFTATATEPNLPPIKTNQLGYAPADTKIAYVSGFEGAINASVGTPFEVMPVSDNRPIFTGQLTLVSENDAGASGERVLLADFSQVTDPGTYYLRTGAYQMPDSLTFTISNDVYDSLLVDSLRYFYMQRQGIELTEEHAGVFARPIGHPQDSAAQLRSGGGTRDVSQGWYDAGDYGKYTNAGATALSDLLWTVEMFPTQFSDQQLNIPESGNGVPDIFDEMRWELDWLLKMQDTDGGFYHMVQPTQSVVPSQATDTRYIEDVNGEQTNVKPTAGTAAATAALAHASLLYQSIDADYASQLLNAALLGWSYLEANPAGVAPVPGPYEDADDSDERFWAATALLRIDNNPSYTSYIEANYQTLNTGFDLPDENGYGVAGMGMIGFLHLIANQNAPEMARSYLVGQFETWREMMLDRHTNSVWGTTLLDEDYYWGSNYQVLNVPLMLTVGARYLGGSEDEAAQVAISGLNYLLGANPLRFSYISGYGEDSLQHPFSAIWNNDGLQPVPNGVLAGGPNAYTNPFFYSNYPAKRYIDSPGAWTINEHTVYWNSALVFNVALAASRADNTPTFAPITTNDTTASVQIQGDGAAPVGLVSETETTAPVSESAAPSSPLNGANTSDLIILLIAAALIGGFFGGLSVIIANHFLRK